jgi:hypothetical protein
MCKKVQTRHIPSLSEAVIVGLGVPIFRMCLKSGLLGGTLESLEANLAFDALSCLVLWTRSISELRFLYFYIMPCWLGLLTVFSCEEGPFFASFAFLSRFCAAFAPLPIVVCVGELWFRW